MENEPKILRNFWYRIFRYFSLATALLDDFIYIMVFVHFVELMIEGPAFDLVGEYVTIVEMT